jgi:site-specific recombinase XerD
MSATPSSALARRLGPVDTEAAILESVVLLPALPAPSPGDRYNAHRLTYSWLIKRKGRTREQYFEDLSRYLTWWDGRHRGASPLEARLADVSDYASLLEEKHAAATAARRLSVVSSWYGFLAANMAIPGNPFAALERPKVSRDASRTVGLTDDEVRAILEAADLEAQTRAARALEQPSSARAARRMAALRDRAFIRLLATMGLRVGEAIGLNLEGLGHKKGHRTVRYRAKGAVIRERPLPPLALEALDDYLAARAATAGVRLEDMTGPLFVTGTGRRTDEPAAFRLIQRIARAAGVPSASRLSPHSLRHAFATNSREQGVPLEDVQDAMGHADPRTTRRYDRDRHNLERDPALKLGALYTARETSVSPAANPKG